MATPVFAGYRGYAKIEDIGAFRFQDASITATQEVNAPDMIMGDWDHDAYNYGPISVGGSISGPVTETFASTTGVFPWACKRTAPCGTLDNKDVELYYYCGSATDGSKNYRKFDHMMVQSVGFSCAAGDVATFTMETIAISAGEWQSLTPDNLGKGEGGFAYPAEKLMTWDKVTVSVAPGSDETVTGVTFANVAYSNFDFTISNNIEPVYSLGQSNLFPYELVPGLRTITGTLSMYNTPPFDGINYWDDYLAANVSTLTFNIGALAIDMKVRFHRLAPASSVGPVVSSIGFTGVTHQTGTVWEA